MKKSGPYPQEKVSALASTQRGGQGTLAAPKKKALLRLDGIGKTFTVDDLSTTVLRDITLTVEKGDFIALMGSSGSGKSTLLYLIGLLERPSSGTYYLLGDDVYRLDDDRLSHLRNQSIGFVFQNFFLIPYATALDNVLLPGTYSDKSTTELRERAEYLLEQVGLADRMNYHPARLSGGQQQRVALARAMLNDPLLLLADEPTGQLDSATSQSIMELLASVNEGGTTLVVVTHSAETAMFARRRLEMHDGRLVSHHG